DTRWPPANRPGVHRASLAEREFAQTRPVRLDTSLPLDEGVSLDAPATERADEPAEIVDQKLRAHHLRGAPDRAHDCRDREAASLTFELGHPSEDLPHGPSIDRKSVV